jgi:hypothetical protein
LMFILGRLDRLVRFHIQYDQDYNHFISEFMDCANLMCWDSIEYGTIVFVFLLK